MHDYIDIVIIQTQWNAQCRKIVGKGKGAKSTYPNKYA